MKIGDGEILSGRQARVILKLFVDSNADVALRDPAKSSNAQFDLGLKTGKHVAARVVESERRVGRKHGRTVQYRILLEAVEVTLLN